MKNIKIGDMVIPFQKSIGIPITDCDIDLNEPLYVVDINEVEDIIYLSRDEYENDGYSFRPSDVMKQL